MSGTAPLSISNFSGSDPFCALYAPTRLDCNCLKFQCDGSGTQGTEPILTTEQCTIDLFICNQRLDFNPDCVVLEPTVVLTETQGTCSLLVNGTIQNMMCRLVDGEIPEDDAIPPTGHFRFTDDYGIIYVVDFEQFADTMDITFTTYDPRVPGEDPSGFLIGTQVFRKGIVTTIRQILKREDDSVVLVSEGSEQRIDFFRTNFACGDELSSDDFCYHVNCAISDFLDIEVTDLSSSGP